MTSSWLYISIQPRNGRNIDDDIILNRHPSAHFLYAYSPLLVPTPLDILPSFPDRCYPYLRVLIVLANLGKMGYR
ncbi:MAG: hypothetical protein ACAH17_02135 [Candidatus Paceibacterota bacterium]